jgi:hypothetical protein
LFEDVNSGNNSVYVMKESYLTRTTPETVGIPRNAIARFVERAAQELNSLQQLYAAAARQDCGGVLVVSICH